MNQPQTSPREQDVEMSLLRQGAGFALASLIILPAVAGSSLTIALHGALMRAANRL